MLGLELRCGIFFIGTLSSSFSSVLQKTAFCKLAPEGAFFMLNIFYKLTKVYERIGRKTALGE